MLGRSSNIPCDYWDGVLLVLLFILHLDITRVLLRLLLARFPDIRLDTFPDRELRSTLANL